MLRQKKPFSIIQTYKTFWMAYNIIQIWMILSTFQFCIGENRLISSKFGWYFTTLANHYSHFEDLCGSQINHFLGSELQHNFMNLKLHSSCNKLSIIILATSAILHLSYHEEEGIHSLHTETKHTLQPRYKCSKTKWEGKYASIQITTAWI